MRLLWTGILVLGFLVAAGCGDDDNQTGNDAGSNDSAADVSVIPDGQVDAYVPPAACNDGLDNDDDGFTDFPDDPGCSDATDMDEYNAPYCGLDALGDPIEVREIPSSGHLVANTVHGSAFYEGSCGGGGGAGELIYRLSVSAGTAGFRVTTNTTMTLFDTVVYVRHDTCDASTAEVACKDDTGDGVELNIDNPAPGTYYIFVDGADPGSMGQFGMEVQGLLGEGTPCDPSDDTLVCGTGMICIEPSPGSPTVCVLAQCSDGLDNDGDGITDFPNEPGCETPLDHDETDTCPGVGCPECADGADNDSDGLTDWPADPGCSGAGDLSELDECVPGLILSTLSPTGTTNGMLIQGPSFLSGTCGGVGGPEDAYLVQLPHGAVRVEATMSSGDMDYAAYLRVDDCGGSSDLACDSSWSGNQAEVFAENLPAGSRLFILADADQLWMPSSSYSLSVAVYLPVGAPCDLVSPLAQCALGGTCQNVAGGYECVPTVCNNGVDDDGDGYTDYPNDPGCTSVADNDELDSCDPVTNPATCPTCFNTLDDDSDGLTDYPNDPGCASAADTSEIDECVPGLPVEDLPITGTANGTISMNDPSYLDGTCAVGSAGERVYSLSLPLGATYVSASLSSMDMEPVVYLRAGDCATGQQLDCEYDWGSAVTAEAHDVSAGTLFIVADAQFVYNNTANFTLSVVVDLPPGAPCQIGNPLMGCGTGSNCLDVGGGVWECVATFCNDGIDNDGDGYTDYPFDPGCDSPDDIDEIDSCDPVTNPIACPACFNGTDDDVDGQTDYPDDLGCSSAADNNEVDLCTVGLPFAPLPGNGQVSSTLSQANPSYLEPGCLPWGSMEEEVFVLSLTGGAESVQATLTSFDMTPVLHVRQGDCSTGVELGCQYTGGSTSVVSLVNVPPGPLFFVADAEWIFNFTASYTLDVSAVLPAGASCDPASTAVTCTAGTTCTDPGGGFVCQ